MLGMNLGQLSPGRFSIEIIRCICGNVYADLRVLAQFH